MTKVSWLKVTALTVLVLGAILLIVGGILYWIYGDMKKDSVKENVILRPDSEGYRSWLNSSTPIYRQLFFFDVVNSADVMQRSARPKVVERGPYTFRVRDNKSDASFDDNDDQAQQLSYSLGRQLDFVVNMSNGTLNDSITIINLPAVTLATWARHGLKAHQKYLAFWLTLVEKLFRQVTVDELLFGFQVVSWKILGNLMRLAFNVSIPADGMFASLMNDANQQYTDNYTIWTGVDDLSRVRKIHMLNGRSSLTVWNSNQSNALNGTDGTGWPPYVDDSTTIDVFDKLWCRSVQLKQTTSSSADGLPPGNETVDDDFDAEIYVQPGDAYNNTAFDRGFCVGDDGECMANGVIDVARCRDDYPLMWSEPHFYQADDRYRDVADGLHPNDTRHRSVVSVQPLTGRVVASSRKLQMNLYIRHLDGFPPTRKLTNGSVFPVLWLSEEAVMSESERSHLRDGVIAKYNRYMRLQRGMSLMMIIGAVLFVVGLTIGLVALVMSKRHSEEETRPLLQSDRERSVES